MPDVKKFILIVIPHTSNWDFPLGIIVRKVLDRDVKYVAKDSLFKGPLGSFFRWTSGIPVNRSKSNNFVDAVVQLYDEHDELIITVAPEGTRKKVDKLKTGFYYIALGAKIPIVMFAFDYGRKEVAIAPPFYPSGDKEADFAFIREHYKGVVGKIPENGWGYEKSNIEN